MPFGCFGKRKKRERSDEPGCEKVGSGGGGGGGGGGIDGNNTSNNKNNNASLAVTGGNDGNEVTEVIAVARAHSLHNAAPNAVENRRTTIGIQKSATLARYDFLRKSDYANTADRWAALKQQYLQVPSADGQQQQQHVQNGAPGGRRAAQSLPRQFAPPATGDGGGAGVVRFSQWFYERQTMEADARREFHEREEKTRAVIDRGNSAAIDDNKSADTHQDAAPTADAADRLTEAAASPPEAERGGSQGQQESPVDNIDGLEQHEVDEEQEDEDQSGGPSLGDKNAAAIKIQANYKGYRTRKVLGKLPSQRQ